MLVYGHPSWHYGKELTCQCRRFKRNRFDPWVGKILWGRKWQPTPIYLPGESHGQRSLADHDLTSVQFSHSVVSDSLRPMDITNSRNLLKLMSVESVIPSNHLILCCPLLLLPSILPNIRVFSHELVMKTNFFC